MLNYFESEWGGGLSRKNVSVLARFNVTEADGLGHYVTTTSGLRSLASCRIPPQILSSSRNPRRGKGVSKPTWTSKFTHVFVTDLRAEIGFQKASPHLSLSVRGNGKRARGTAAPENEN